MQSICETQTRLDSAWFSNLNNTLTIPISCSQHTPPNLAVPRPVQVAGPEEIKYLPSPTSSPVALRLSAAAAAHLWNPYYPAYNRPIPKFHAAHSSRHAAASGSHLSISQIESVSSTTNGASIPAQLNDALGKELTANTLHTNCNFLKKLLPHERLPFPVNEELLRKMSTAVGENTPIWNGLRSCFHQPYFGEAAVCEWLNNTGKAMGLVYSHQCERLWWSGCCSVPLVTSSAQQRPDLVLLDRSYYDKRSQEDFANTRWASVKAVAEVHQPLANAQLTNITTRSYLTFLCQPHRRFTISLSFFNANLKKPQFSVTVMDRIGQICVTEMDLMESSVENGLLLLSILAFLMFGSPEDVGLDPHFEINPLNGRIIALECGNRRFKVLKRIHALPTLFGRGTQVWIVALNGIRYIMKDSWDREDRNNNEVGHLRRMITHTQLQGRAPTLICGGDVVINGFKDSTRHYRSASYAHRIHRRIVTSPIGESITSFRTKKEFIRVLMNVIETHRYLHNHVGILHGDLSINNIMLNRTDNESEATGLLIDYDLSVETKVTQGSAPNASDRRTSRTGTPPFMAIESLLANNQTFVHKPQHDLESILYIILYICTFFRGPGLPPALSQHEFDIAHHLSPPIRTWFSNDADLRKTGYLKLAHLECYDTAIIPYFAPYWNDFVPFVTDLIIACFPAKACLPNDFQYNQVLQILKTAYDSVEEPQTGCLPVTRLKRRSNSSDRDSKKGRRL